MASFDYTTTGLLASIRRRASLPSATTSGTADSDLILFADEALTEEIVPLIMSVREEYFVAVDDTTLTASTTSFRIPYRAIGRKLREISIVSGNNVITDVPRYSTDDLQSASFGFYIQGDKVMLVNTSGSIAGTWRMHYYRTPSKLVAIGAAAVISAINTTTKVVTVLGVPSNMSSSTMFDFVRADPGFDCLAIDQTASIASTNLTFTSALPAELAVGDYVTLPGESPIPQIPPELHNLLAQSVAVKVMEAMGDNNGVGMAKSKLDEMRRQALILIEERVDGESAKAVNRSALFPVMRSGW